MQKERFSFPGSQGGELAARLDLPDGAPRAYALFAHCFTCSKDIFAASKTSEALAAQGIAVLRFDFTGLGHSDGEFANTNFSSNVQDLILAADHLRQTRAAPSILIGHSLGGAAVLAAASDLPEVRAVATIGAPAEPVHVRHNFEADVDQIREEGAARVELGGRTFTIRKQFLEDLETQNLLDKVAGLKRPLMIFHSPIDQTVGIENAAKIYKAAKHPKSFTSLDTASHLLADKADAAYVGLVLSAWVSRYLEPTSEVPHWPLSSRDGVVSVGETGAGDFQNEVVMGRHRQLADEPIGIGADTGPTPYDYLSAGLGACTTMTLRMYAKRRGLPLDRAVVHVSHERIHAKDCKDCETTEGRLDQFTRELRLVGDLSAEQKAKLLEIADKCPVHRTLREKIKVVTTLS